ncbi:MAG: hypothetical protein PHN56_00615 [Candidatus Nanoarchaeia archaeon]|nr:hypothetical protein [Candidatus Nanoarchaeia archaeon]
MLRDSYPDSEINKLEECLRNSKISQEWFLKHKDASKEEYLILLISKNEELVCNNYERDDL